MTQRSLRYLLFLTVLLFGPGTLDVGRWTLAVGRLSAQQLSQSEIPTPINERSLATRFENLGVREGLTQSTVFDLIQDRHGYM